LDSGFVSGLSALGVGFDSGLSGFDFTAIVLLFLLDPPRAYFREARELFAQAAQPLPVERAIEKDSSLEVCEFLEAGALTQQIVQAFQTGSCKNYQLV
jgi:hypothetical protein